MLGILIATVVFGGLAVFLRWFGSRKNPTILVVQPANTTAIVLLKSNTEARDKDGKVIGVNNDGGDIVDVIHTAPGKKLDKSDADPMEWKLVLGKERRNVLYHILGITPIGLFRYLRINAIRTHRWGRRDTDESYSVMPKTDHTRFAHFQGQHDIVLKKVETREIISFDLRLNLTVEETYPVRARYRTADAYAQLTIIASDHVIDEMGEVDPKEFIEGTPDQQTNLKKNLKQRLTDSFSEIKTLIENETGLTIRNASLPDFDFDEATRKLLEAKTKARLEGEASVVSAEKKAQQTVILATADRDAQKLRNAADEDRINKVIKPAAADELLSANFRSDREAAAYERNTTVSTWVNGSNATPVIPVGK